MLGISVEVIEFHEKRVSRAFHSKTIEHVEFILWLEGRQVREVGYILPLFVHEIPVLVAGFVIISWRALWLIKIGGGTVRIVLASCLASNTIPIHRTFIEVFWVVAGSEVLIIPGHPHVLIANHAEIVLSKVADETTTDLHFLYCLYDTILIGVEPAVNASQIPISFFTFQGSGPAFVVISVALVSIIASPADWTFCGQIAISSQFKNEGLRTFGWVYFDFKLFFCVYQKESVFLGDFVFWLLKLGQSGGLHRWRSGGFFHSRERSPRTSLITALVELVTESEEVRETIVIVAKSAEYFVRSEGVADTITRCVAKLDLALFPRIVISVLRIPVFNSPVRSHTSDEVSIKLIFHRSPNEVELRGAGDIFLRIHQTLHYVRNEDNLMWLIPLRFVFFQPSSILSWLFVTTPHISNISGIDVRLQIELAEIEIAREIRVDSSQLCAVYLDLLNCVVCLFSLFPERVSVNREKTRFIKLRQECLDYFHIHLNDVVSADAVSFRVVKEYLVNKWISEVNLFLSVLLIILASLILDTL